MDPASEPIRQATVCSRSGALLREGASLESGVVGKAIHGQKCLVGELHETTSKGHVVLRRRVLSPVEGFRALQDLWSATILDDQRRAAARTGTGASSSGGARGAPAAPRAPGPGAARASPAAARLRAGRARRRAAPHAHADGGARAPVKSLPPGRPSTPARPAKGPVSARRRDRERTNGHGDVRALDDATFDRCVADDATWMVNFYASWCVYCTRLAPAWRELAAAATAARGGAVRVGAVDVMANPKLAKRFGIRGFPTIVLFRGGSMYAAAPKYEYVGVRSPESLVAFAFGGFEDLAKPLPVPPPDDEPEQRTPPKAPKPSPRKKSPKKRADAREPEREPEPEPEPEAAAAAVEPRSPQPAAPAAPRRRGPSSAGGRAPRRPRARAPPREDTRTLVAHLVEPFGDDAARARAVFAWVADNVAHAAPSLLEEEHPEAVLRRGTADALGYANVLKHLLDVAGIPSMALRGLCKDAPAATLAAPARHAWSAVQLDGDWRLCDACLGAGVQRGGSWAKRFDAYWWSVDPDKFLASHLPDAPLRHWQLVPRPLVDRAAWEDLPRVHHAAADAHGVALAAPLAARVAHGAPTPFRASFDCPPAVALVASLRKRGGAGEPRAPRLRAAGPGGRRAGRRRRDVPRARGLLFARRVPAAGDLRRVRPRRVLRDRRRGVGLRPRRPAPRARGLARRGLRPRGAGGGAVGAGGAAALSVAQHPDAPLLCAELAVGVRAPGRRRVDVRATLAGDAWGHFVGDVRLDRGQGSASSSGASARPTSSPSSPSTWPSAAVRRPPARSAPPPSSA
ncbi:hypothetical protein JL721_6959 [Aureococcus anophagefferens]|nr:hypothetical protein JL721_6959 [Aureococcus anophagefferens]